MPSRVNSIALVIICGLLPLELRVGVAQSVQVSPTFIQITAPADTLFPLGAYSANIGIGTIGNVPWKFVRAAPADAGVPDIDFLIVSPSSGTAPGGATIALNPRVVPYMTPPGTVTLDRVLYFAPSDQPWGTPGVIVGLRLLGSPGPSVEKVVGAATLQPTISPGELVSIFGANLSTPPLNGEVSNAGLYPTKLGNTVVTFNGIPAPLLYVSKTQINCVVPSGVAGKQTVDVVVDRTYPTGYHPSAVTLPLLDTSPGIFTLDQSGTGQGVILNADPVIANAATLNGARNPASKGSAITLFATGVGAWNFPYPDGSVVLNPFAVVGVPMLAPSAPVSLTIGGHPAKLLYVAAEAWQVLGMLQVNAVVPDGIESGQQPIVLKIGANDNSQQKVTIAIK